MRGAIESAEQIVCGIGAAPNKGIAHGDLKPENIFLPRHGHFMTAQGEVRCCPAVGQKRSARSRFRLDFEYGCSLESWTCLDRSSAASRRPEL
ncbi:hypothetical protein SBA1_30065 [Candidatus Sulfotelmatobacter kueseliae]|uniref:Uncharacterized protein n=1 Tax=Candidatus Sulfotelmatobacter kueseliae TaxID=2042962 RepID=A0A2U3KKP4_9BACT|nr:hypothetical protein SBA1_30065 [Candidatus Sulfotelmatobacter kueseliae]